MPSKNLTLGLALVCASSALAHHREHHVHKTSTHAGAYVTRNGDFDWAIAHKHGISVAKLHRANPNVNWTALRVGIHIHIPGGSESVVASRHASGHAASHSGSHLYAIKDGDNDWILAHRTGITVRQLKSLNPSVNWDRIHPGEHITLPGSSRVAEASTSHRIHSRYAKITTEDVRIHRGQGLHSSIITTVDSGTVARVLDRDGSWYRLRFPKGTEGWVRSDFLASAETPHHYSRSHHHHETYTARRHRRHHHGDSGEYLASNEVPDNALIHKALTYKNTPYVWGGTSRSGADCSGYTKMVFHSQGIALPRTSREQSQVGKHVSKDQLRAGDLVFFHTGRGSRVTHAAIYIGHGKFIHSSSGGGHVQVNSLSSGYYANHFATARRVLSTKHKAK